MKIKRFKKYKCKFNPRKTYQGSQIKPELKQFIGKTLTFESLWIFDEDERYKGEWAMKCLDAEMFKETTWIAEGDLEIIAEI